jgi:hypothetical protein
MSFSLGSPLGGGLVYRGPIFVPGAGTAGATQPAVAPTFATQGFGITAGPASGGPRTAHYGLMITAAISAGLLGLLYYALPR